MRKILLVILIVSIFSFSIVYAQEIYGVDKVKDDQQTELSMNSESKWNEEKMDGKDNDALKTEAAEKQEENKDDGNQEVSQPASEGKDGQAPSSINKSTPRESSKNTNQSSAKSYGKKLNVETKPVQQETKNKNTKNTEKEPVKEASKSEKKADEEVDGSPVIDTSNAKKGSFKAKYLSSKKLKVMVVKGSEKYTYDFKGDNSYQSYPLQLGDGTYKISIMENIEGKQYKYVLSKEVEIKASNPNDKYLTSVQMINWNNSMSAIKKAKSLAGSASDKQKVSKIYSYVVNNIRYDSSITSLPSGYVPSINTTYSSKKGICYDFASLFAGMLRSVGVPTKLIKGESSNVIGYHAWNEVYIDGSWRIIDTSYDSQLRAAGYSYSMYKSGKEYTKSKEY